MLRWRCGAAMLCDEPVEERRAPVPGRFATTSRLVAAEHILDLPQQRSSLFELPPFSEVFHILKEDELELRS
jgi:hypothetical protein